MKEEVVISAPIWKGETEEIYEQVTKKTIPFVWEGIFAERASLKKPIQDFAARLALTINQDPRLNFDIHPEMITPDISVTNPAQVIFAGYPAIFLSCHGRVMVRPNGDYVNLSMANDFRDKKGWPNISLELSRSGEIIKTIKESRNESGKLYIPISVAELLEQADYLMVIRE